MVWAAIGGADVIGHFFTDENADEKTYLKILKYKFFTEFLFQITPKLSLCRTEHSLTGKWMSGHDWMKSSLAGGLDP